MALAFPAGPTGGQQYTGPNGIVYQWDSAVGVWIKVNSVQTMTSGSTATTGSARIPTGNTAARPAATLAAGQFRYNSQLLQLEYSDGTSWLAAGGGGTVTGVTATAPLASSGGVAPDISLTGTVPILNGGTGATTVPGVQANLLPAQAGNAGKVLSTDGAGVISWASAGGTGTITSVDVSGGTTGLTYSGGPITTSGTITMAGTLGVANGGTGATTVAGAQANLLPAQATHAGEFLKTDGAGVLSWASGGGGGSDIPAGSVMLFYQAAAPVGWTQVTTQDDKALRVVSGAGAGTGGTNTFSSTFTSVAVPVPQHTHTVADPTHIHSGAVSISGMFRLNGGGVAGGGFAAAGSVAPGSAAGSISVPAAATGISIAAAGTAGATVDFNVQYIDIILCSKN